MKEITKEEFANSETMATTYFNNLKEEEKAVYVDCINYYYNLLIEFLEKKLNISTFDKNLAESENNFTSVSEEKMDIYQYLSSYKFKYMYIRNNIYLDRLTNAEIMKLRNFMKTNETLDNPELLAFVESTYQKLIDENPELETTTNYGPLDPKYFGNSKGITIGYRTDEFADTEKENWAELHQQREFELDFFNTFVKISLEKKSDVPINLIRYDETSVKKKTSNNLNTMKNI